MKPTTNNHDTIEGKGKWVWLNVIHHFVLACQLTLKQMYKLIPKYGGRVLKAHDECPKARDKSSSRPRSRYDKCKRMKTPKITLNKYSAEHIKSLVVQSKPQILFRREQEKPTHISKELQTDSSGGALSSIPSNKDLEIACSYFLAQNKDWILRNRQAVRIICDV